MEMLKRKEDKIGPPTEVLKDGKFETINPDDPRKSDPAERRSGSTPVRVKRDDQM